jgi:hypothetical protein
MKIRMPVKAAVPLCGAVFTALVFSVFFVAFHADHDCSHDVYCPVCLQIQEAARLLTHGGSAPARFFAGAGFWGAAGFPVYFPPDLTNPTSVNLKTRLNT